MNTDRDTKVIQLYRDNISPKIIAKECNIAYQTVYEILKRHNIKPNRHGRGSIKIPTEEYINIIQLYEGGLTTTKIGKIYNVNHDTIGRLLGILGVNKRLRKYKIYENFFEEIDTPEKAYIFGLLIADGHVDRDESTFTIDLKIEDQYIIEYVRSKIFINNDKPIIYYDNMSRMAIHSVKITSDLIKLGCIPNKTYDYTPIHIPKDMLFWDFLRGLFDGDGCFHSRLRNNRKTKAQYFQLCLNKSFVKTLAEELHKRGFNPHIYDHPTSKFASYLYITKKDELVQLYHKIYYNNLPSMIRKKDKWFSRITEIINDRDKNVR